MKKTILWSMLFLLVIALIPLASGIKGVVLPPQSSDITNKITDNTSPITAPDEDIENLKLSEDEIEIIVCKVMEHITEDADTDTKKSILAICKNNYLYLKDQGTTDFEADISKYSDDFLDELLKLYKENEYTISLQGECVPIPLIPQNGGFTATSDEYPYIQPTASPWDTFSKSYIRGAKYPCGVSVYGIGYLCESGLNWKDALRWYLPNFSIS